MMTVRVGDMVNWKGCFGVNTPRPARVLAMEVTEFPRSKYGKSVDEVDAKLIKDNRVLFTLNNGHWAYAEQIEMIDL